MMLELAAALELSRQCAPTVAPETLLAVVRAESAFNPNAIGVNRGRKLVHQPATRAEAVQTASALLRAGSNFDAGLGQINSSNFAWLGLTVETVFDPCRNLAAAGRVLEANYVSARRTAADAQAALRVALSMYNTGDRNRGFRNGYVRKVQTAAGHVVPALGSATRPQPAPADEVAASGTPSIADEGRGGLPPPAATPRPPEWDVFGRAAAGATLVFTHPNAPQPPGSAAEELTHVR